MSYQRHTELKKMWATELYCKVVHLANKTINKCKEAIAVKDSTYSTYIWREGRWLWGRGQTSISWPGWCYDIVHLIKTHSAMNFLSVVFCNLFYNKQQQQRFLKETKMWESNLSSTSGSPLIICEAGKFTAEPSFSP